MALPAGSLARARATELPSVGAVVSLGVQGFLRDAQWVTHTHDNLEQISQLYSRTKDAESAQRGYLITGNAEYLGEFYAAKPDLDRRAAALRQSMADNSRQSARLAEVVSAP